MSRSEPHNRWQRVVGQTLALVLLVFGTTTSLATAQTRSRSRTTDAAVIKRFLLKQQSRENGFEDEGNERIVRTGDLNHDDVPDQVVLYTLEGQNGTNNYVQHLAVFVRTNGRLVPVTDEVVGGKYYRSADLKSIKDNQILFDTLDYADSDARCCPSIKGSTKYVLRGHKIKELRHK